MPQESCATTRQDPGEEVQRAAGHLRARENQGLHRRGDQSYERHRTRR